MTTDDWIKLLGIGAGVGTSLYGANQASNAAQQQNTNVANSQAQLTQIAEEERKRRDALTQMFMPSLLRDMGMNGGQRTGMLGSMFSRMGGGQTAPQPQPGVSPGGGGYQSPNDLIMANNPYDGDPSQMVSGGDASTGPLSDRQRRGAL